MSILLGCVGAVYVLSAPRAQRDNPVCGPQWMYWFGGSVWSPRLSDATLFQSYEAAKVHVEFLGITEWQIQSHEIPADAIRSRT